MTQQHSTRAEVTGEIPSPWKSLYRFLVGTAKAGAVFAGVWGAWYGYAAYRLHAELAHCRAQGPASLEALAGPTLRPEENRVVQLAAVWEAMRLPGDEISLPYWYQGHLVEQPLSMTKIARMGIAARYQAQQPQIRQACRVGGVSWPELQKQVPGGPPFPPRRFFRTFVV